ncbi:MAG: hypothetical protein CM15mP127_14920 [Gammaproteobacteria bacterium]|nr:MAG: hypothetical protein CM15mP127_14920 [Gammaproteobacteria bacterium]
MYLLPAADFDFSDLVEKQKSSVVNIESTRKVSVSGTYNGRIPEELFREFGFLCLNMTNQDKVRRGC